jgi:tetratricopeptide (TPR) repeat protein
MGTGAAAIAHVFAEVRQALPDLPPPPALEAAQERFRFFDSLTTCLKNAAQRQPLLLVLDDLHWADTPSLLLLQFLAREMDQACLCIVGTYRDVALDQHHPLTQTLGELGREPGHQRLCLQGLSQDEVACFLASTIGVTPHEAVVACLYRQTEGNPFFLTEVVRLLVTSGTPVTRLTPHAIRGLGLPQAVREVIGRRLHTLAAPCHSLLTLASVIGRDFDLATLAQVSNTSREYLLHTLESAVETHIITPNPQTVGSYCFTHALIHDMLYADLSTAERVRLHRRVGELLQERCGLPGACPTGRLPAHILAALAHHFYEAARGGGVNEQAISYAVQAGQHATAMLAYEEAAAHYARALALMALLHPTDARQRSGLLVALGHAQAQAGEIPQARETLLQAAEVARRVGAPELLIQAVLGFEKMGVDTGVVDQRLVVLLEEALNTLGEQESALQARLLARLAQELHYAVGSGARRVTLSQRAVAMARQSGDPIALAAALDSRRLDLWGTQDVQERLATITEIIQLAEAVGNRERAMRSRIDRIATLLALGERMAADAELTTYTQLAAELRQPRYLWNVQLTQTLQALLEGRFMDGEHLARQAFTLGQRVQPHTATQFLGVQLLVLHWEQGKLQALEETVKSFAHQFPVLPWRSVLALIYCEFGRQAEARQELDRLGAHGFADLARDDSWLIALALLSEVCYALEDTRRASTLYDLMLPYARQNVVVSFGIACLGSVSRYLGLLATTLARWDAAEGHFRAALEMHARLGARPFLARTQYAYAAMLLARHQLGDHEQARPLAEAALATAQALGMQGIVGQVLTLQSRLLSVLNPAPILLASCPSSTLEQDSPPGPLFQPEGDCWTLAYQGVTCRLKDSKGLRYIADLLQAPGRTFHALELATLRCAGRRSAADAGAAPDLAVTAPGDLGAILDAPAKAAYKRRLCELQGELEEAEQYHDLARATAVQAEIDALTHQLAIALGLGGRDRKVGSTAERARSAVTKAIKAAVQKIQAHHPALGHHLLTHLKTGTFCKYLPAPTQAVHWQQNEARGSPRHNVT